MLQPIFADCILRGRRKSTTAKRKRGKKTRRMKGHTGEGGGREMPINESASAKTRPGCAKEQSYDQNDKRGRTEDGENPIARWWCDSLAHKTRGGQRSPRGGPTLGVSSRVCHRRNRPTSRASPDFPSTPIRALYVNRSASRKRTHNRPFLANVNANVKL